MPAFQREIPVRFGHCDPATIVFYPRYFEMISSLVEDWFQDGLEASAPGLMYHRGIVTPTVHFTVDFLNAAWFGDRLTFNLGGTYLTRYRVAITPTAPLTDQLNTIFNPLRLKMRTSVTWDHGPLTARLLWVHINGYKNTAANPVQQVASFNPVDLSLSWKIGDSSASNMLTKGLTLGVEVRNVLGEAPPYVNIAPTGNGSGGYDATAADPIGRLFAVSLRKSF